MGQCLALAQQLTPVPRRNSNISIVPLRRTASKTALGLIALAFLASCAGPHSWAGAPVTFAAFGHRIIAPGQSSGVSNGDTWDTAWSTNDTLYFQHNDGTGFSNGPFAHDRICRLQGTPQSPSSLAGTDLNPGILGTSLSGSPCYSTGLYEVDGVLYHNVCYSQQIPGAWVFHHTSILKSLDGGKTWINHLGQVNVMPPDNTNQCMFPSDNWGEVNFVKYGSGGAAPSVDNAQTYVYLCAAWADCRLARIARTNLSRLEKTQIQFYRGGDGLLDSSWTNNIALSAPIPTPSISPAAMVYNQGLGRYIMTSFSSDSWQQPPIESTLRVMEAPHPWGPWKLVLNENVNNLEGDNLTWAFLVPKFTSADGKKMWMSVAGRAPYGLQFMPVYLTTEPVQLQEAETAAITGGFVATSTPGYSGTGYVSGLDSIDKKCEFTFTLGSAGVYLMQFRYDTSGYRNLGFYVNGRQRSVLKLGKSEQVYATWTSLSLLTWLGAGTNVIGLQCVDSLGNINLDNFSLALYSTNATPDLKLSFNTQASGFALNFDPIPGLTYNVDWSSNLAAAPAWQSVTNFTSTGSAVQISYRDPSPAGFLRIEASP